VVAIRDLLHMTYFKGDYRSSNISRIRRWYSTAANRL